MTVTAENVKTSAAADKLAYSSSVDIANNVMGLVDLKAYMAALEYGTLYDADGKLLSESSTLTTARGAAIRTGVPTGLRFTTSIGKAEYAEMTAAGTVSIGTIIAPLAYVQAAGEFTKEGLDALGHPVNYLDVQSTGFLSETDSELYFRRLCRRYQRRPL
jgi:hypothetical protein